MAKRTKIPWKRLECVGRVWRVILHGKKGMPNARIDVRAVRETLGYQASADLYIMVLTDDPRQPSRSFHRCFANCCCIRGASRQALEFLKSLDWKPAKKQPQT